MKHLGAVLLCLVLVATGIAAQEFADHPLIGSHEGSETVHQERSVYAEYRVVTDYNEDGDVTGTETVRGSATMTLYNAPEDTSTFTVYETYRAFLEGQGFEILVQCGPGECPHGLVEEFYFLLPFADNGNYGHPAPFTNGNDDLAGFITARKAGGGTDTYVSLAVNAGWASYPQYRLDVVETGTNPGRIASSGDDHPVVGSYVGAYGFHQERSTFGEYTFATAADPAEGEITDTVTVQGDVVMTLYQAPWDASTYTIYATYREFLQEQGFTIVLDYKPREASNDLLSAVYNLQPFADTGNYYHPAIFSNGNSAHAALITARREHAGEALYVTVEIANGWASQTEYRLDVIQVGTNPGSISSTGTIGTSSGGDDEGRVGDQEQAPVDEPTGSGTQTTGGTPSGGAPSAGGGFLTGNGGFRAIAGVGVLALLDPAVAGILADTDDDGTVSAEPNGFRNNVGPFAEIAWFPNANFGIGFGVSQFFSDEGFQSDDDYYRSIFDTKLLRLMAITRMVGADVPAAINMSLTGGVSIVELELSKEGGAGDYVRGADEVFGVVGCTVEMTVPILSFIHFSAGLDFFYVPFTELEIRDQSGDPFVQTLHEGNLGGMSIRVGLVGSVGGP